MAGIDHSKLRGLGNLQQSFRWRVEILGPVEGLDGFDLRCETITLPNRTDNTIEQSIRGNKVRRHGTPEYNSPLSMTFVEDESGTIQNAIEAWKQLCWNDDDSTQNSKAEYEGTVKMILLDAKNEDTDQIYTLYGAYPGDFVVGDLTAEDSSFMKPQLSLVYDYFRFGKISS